MLSVARSAGIAAVLMVGTVVPAVAQVPQVGVSVKVSREAAPPGAVAQMKVLITEPKPITTGYAEMSFFGFSDIEGIALGSGDAAGIAIVRGGGIALSVVSPTATFGMEPDYPAVTVAGRVQPFAPLGTRFPMALDPGALQFADPTGVVYPSEIRNGYLLAARALSIGDVIPGSADLPAGATVTILGTGFRPDTRVRLKETALAEVRYVGPGRIDVVLAEPTRMHGKGIRARNRDGAEATYFSYQRTHATSLSAHPVLQHVVPIFPVGASLQGSVQLSGATAGIAVQNLETTDTLVFAELLDSAGRQVAVSELALPGNSYVVRTVSEIFRLPSPGSGLVRLTGAGPVQILGIDISSTGAATPRLPQ